MLLGSSCLADVSPSTRALASAACPRAPAACPQCPTKIENKKKCCKESKNDSSRSSRIRSRRGVSELTLYGQNKEAVKFAFFAVVDEANANEVDVDWLEATPPPPTTTTTTR